MAEWKKIVVSGSDISQLNNDSGYLKSTGTIDSASVAARATTLSADATASYALLASDARTADSASVAARATTLSADATASYALLASDARTATSASIAALASTLSPTATASFADVAGTARSADELNPLATASYADLAGDARTATSASIAEVATLARNADSASVAARATTLSPLATASFADVAGTSRAADSASVAARATTLSADATASFADVAGTARLADSSSVAARATLLSADATASYADLAGDARTATSASIASTAGTASVADRATTLSADATASFALVAGTSRNADSASVAARATLLSADATASFADLASTVHDGNITTAKIADGNVTNAKLQNDSITFGVTEQALGSTITSITGLTNISAVTGTFVLQVFESASTIITSGSNIFGDKQDDIQQFTGSILQTGSMIVSGNLSVAVGQISGTFVGDGSGLTGLATSLTVDGDSGTQDVDLLVDDLQVLGTANRITTAITKVGNDVKVTLNLADTVEVTASVATRANSLSPLATASYADVASVARTSDSSSVAARATTLSADATASYALLASDARTADSASVAARATTLSADATASFALVAGNARNADSASNAVNAVSASATTAGVLFPTADGLAGQALVTDGAGTFAYGDIFGTGSTKKLNQTVAAATWSFQHNLDEVYPIVQVYDSTGDQLLPERVESIDANNIKLYFAEATSGVAAAMVGGMGISASNATRATSASIADEASTLSATATASFALVAGTSRNADSASVAAIATTLSADATASYALLASDARTADSASVAARATTLSADATASYALLASDARTATTASHALGGAGLFSGSFVGDGSGLTGVASDFNFSGDTGATTISLTTETASFVGTAGEIETTVTNNQLQIGLPSNVTIGSTLTVAGNATIGGDLIVNGAIVSASSLEIADQFIILASGSNGPIDGGIIINQIDNDADGQGKAFAYDSSANRWAIQGDLNDTASVITPDAYMGVIQEGTFNAATAPLYGSTAGKGTIFVDNSGDVYIYG
tara:strand:+ start:1111 stop:4113 length:3003 start_codon:yes stop_codon:yes gene_type:complete